MKNQYMEIARANGVEYFHDYVFTGPQEIWNDINSDFLKDWRRLIAKSYKKVCGLDTKTRGTQNGFQVLFHPVSSGDPFTKKPHFHLMGIPILVNKKTGEIKTLPKKVNHKTLKAVYKKYFDKLLKKYGFEHAIKDVYNVRLHYREIAHVSEINHVFKYNNRSQIQDILNRIKRVKKDFSSFVCLMIDKKESTVWPEIKTKDQVLDALQYVMNPGFQVRMAYGFLRTLEKYSEALNIERDEYNDLDNWQTVYFVDVVRAFKKRWHKEQKKIIAYYEVWVRKKDSFDEWIKLKPDELSGERSCMSNRKLFKARG